MLTCHSWWKHMWKPLDHPNPPKHMHYDSKGTGSDNDCFEVKTERNESHQSLSAYL